CSRSADSVGAGDESIARDADALPDAAPAVRERHAAGGHPSLRHPRAAGARRVLGRSRSSRHAERRSPVSSEAGALELLARVVAEALSPLKDRLQAGQAAALFDELGLRPPDGFLSGGGVGGALASGATAAQNLANSVPPLITSIETAKSDDAGSIATLISRGVDTTTKIVAMVTAIKNLA